MNLSKTGRKWSPAPVPVLPPPTSDLEIQRKKKQSPRSPLKDLNGITSCSSSNASSMSIEAPRGCLRLFLSNSSSSSSRTPLHRSKTLSKTPKSAPIVRPSKPSRSKPPNKNPLKPTISANPERPTSQKLHKSKKNPPCLYQWQSGKKPNPKISQRPKPSPVLDTNDIFVNKLASGFGELKHQQRQCLLRTADEGEPTKFRLSGLKSGNDENFTPVSKLVSGSGLDCTFDKLIGENSNTTTTTTPPVEASVSPEIQCGSSVVSTTPAVCYGAGYIVSGVTDKRKCRSRGILAVGENDSGFSRTKDFDGFNNDGENVVGDGNSSRLSIIPLPTEASMHWLLSPRNEEDDDGPKGLSDNGSHRFQRLMGSASLHSPSSPSSVHGFSSDVCNPGSSTKIDRRRSKTSLLSPSVLPEFQGFVGSSYCPHATPSCEAAISQEEKKYRYNLAGENSPFSMDSLGSGNVIRTPQSDSSSDRQIDLNWLNVVNHQKHQLECELDSVAEVLQMTSFSPKSQKSMWDPTSSSFQFDCLTTPSNSIDFTLLQKTWDYEASWISNSTLENVSQSHMRISWREGLVSRLFEMDELDCCRCLSDEEEDAKDCSNDQFKPHLNPKLTDDVRSDQSLTNTFGSPKFVDHGPGIGGKGKENFPLQKSSLCAESISTDGGGLVVSGDSDWTLCYKNELFEV
ncbi:hypothetical protein L1049_017234 [Liquidambar formosana]|uniref:Uncharacterized protein n=1 Tax=Liquidambar formosana TaxID=63359 RepID=A0AAP0S7J2_LIQFO